MKKAVAIFFCIQIFSGNTFAAELTKFPFLIKHFLEHNAEQKDGMNIADFLWEHYVYDAHEKQGDCEEKLPFKHCHDCCSHVAASIACVVPDATFTLATYVKMKEQSVSPETNFISYYQSCIWQPPKIG